MTHATRISILLAAMVGIAAGGAATLQIGRIRVAKA